MDTILDVVSSLTTSIIMLLLTLYLNNKINTQKLKTQEDLKNHKERIDDQDKRTVATQNGVQALLRNALVSSYERGHEKGFVPIYERENINYLYHNYKNLDGNGVIEDLMEKVMDLPTDPPKPKLKRTKKYEEQVE